MRRYYVAKCKLFEKRLKDAMQRIDGEDLNSVKEGLPWVSNVVNDYISSFPGIKKERFNREDYNSELPFSQIFYMTSNVLSPSTILKEHIFRGDFIAARTHAIELNESILYFVNALDLSEEEFKGVKYVTN